MPAARAAAQLSRKRSSAWSPPSVALMKAKSMPERRTALPVDVALVLGDVDAVDRVLPRHGARPVVGIGVAEAGDAGDGRGWRGGVPALWPPPQDSSRHASRTTVRLACDTALGALPVFSATIPLRLCSVTRFAGEVCRAPLRRRLRSRRSWSEKRAKQTGRTIHEDDQGARRFSSAQFAGDAAPFNSLGGDHQVGGGLRLRRRAGPDLGRAADRPREGGRLARTTATSSRASPRRTASR